MSGEDDVVPNPTITPESPAYDETLLVSLCRDGDSTRTTGGFVDVYPKPAFVILIESTDLTPPTEVVIATAVALSTGFPVGEAEIVTVGVDV